MATFKNTTVDNTGAVTLATGTTAQRVGSPSVGMMRYNTTISDMEYWNGTSWYNGLGIHPNKPASGPVALAAAGVNTNGYYWLDIGDGRGNSLYYCVFDYPGGPWAMVHQSVNSQTGDLATPGITTSYTSANGLPTGTTFFNTNIAGLNLPITGYMVTNDLGAIFYMNIDSTNRNIFYTELLDTAGETSNSTNAYSAFVSSSGGIYSDKTTPIYTWSSNTNCVVELHHSNWDPATNINYMIIVGITSKSPGSGMISTSYGFDQQGRNIQASTGYVSSGTKGYGWIKL